MYSEILARLVTKEDVSELMREIMVMEDSLYKSGDAGFEKILESEVRSDIAGIIKSNMNAGNIRTIEEKKNYLDKLREELEKLKLLRLELAVDFPRKWVAEIAKWVSNSLGAGNILQIEVNPEILGGAKISYEGKYVDLTLQTKINEVWEKESGEILHQYGL